MKASSRWKKIHQRESRLTAKVARQRRDWQLENPTQPKMDCAAETKTDFPHKVTSDIARGYDIGVTCQRDDPQGWQVQSRAKQVHSAERWFSPDASHENHQAEPTLSQVRGSPQGLGRVEEPPSCLFCLWFCSSQRLGFGDGNVQCCCQSAVGVGNQPRESWMF